MSLFESASLVVTPNGTKASKLYAIKPTSGAGDLTVTRATTARRVNSAGLIESVAVNVPRLDYTDSSCPSILVEPQRTNIVLYSEQFDNAAWIKSTQSGTLNVTANHSISPDGTQNADRLQMSISGFGSYSDAVQLFSTTAGISYTYSIYLKSLSGTPTIAILYDSASASNKLVTLTNEWKRYTITINPSGTLMYPRILLENGITSNSADILAWGSQLEIGSYATSYIPTVASAVTRNTDIILKNSISSLIGQTEGTLFLDFYYNGLSNNHMIINDASFTSYIYINSQNANEIWGQIQNIGIQFSTAATAGRYKCALAYKSGNSAFYVNGTQVGTSATAFSLSGNIATLDYTISTPKNNINASALWKTRLTNAELIELTSL